VEAEPVATGTTASAEGSAVADDDACRGGQETVNGYLDDDGCADELPPELAAITGVVEGITFAIDKDILRLDTSQPALDRLVDVLARHPQVRVEIQVHEASKPPPSYGRCLSCRRAKAIADYLVVHGIEPARVMAQGYGDDRPIESNDTPQGRQKNRRVEVRLLAEDGRPVMSPAARNPVAPVSKMRRGGSTRGSDQAGRMAASSRHSASQSTRMLALDESPKRSSKWSASLAMVG
jgi:outer membrane protein OmpA-like peptidoglycan-associated protein